MKREQTRSFRYPGAGKPCFSLFYGSPLKKNGTSLLLRKAHFFKSSLQQFNFIEYLKECIY